MLGLPKLPDWDGLHPLVIHFPVALLMVAPVLIGAGLLLARQRAGFYASSLVLMLLGIASAYLSVSTGEAAARVADRTPQVTRLIEEHSHLASRVLYWYAGLTMVWLCLLLLLHRQGGRWKTWVRGGAVLLFLLGYLPGFLWMANMAHAGGRLVHENGVHAMLPPEP